MPNILNISQELLIILAGIILVIWLLRLLKWIKEWELINTQLQFYKLAIILIIKKLNEKK